MVLSMSIWIYLLAAAAGISSTMMLILKPKKETMRRAVRLGLFLFAFDFVFENLGLLAGFWHTSGSLLQLGAVPIEVTFIAFFAGHAYAMLFPKKFDLRLALPTTLLIAVAGTGIEALINSQGALIYTGGWTSYYALVAYFVAFFILHKANSML